MVRLSDRGKGVWKLSGDARRVSLIPGKDTFSTLTSTSESTDTYWIQDVYVHTYTYIDLFTCV